MPDIQMSFTPEKIKKLQVAYDKAVKDEQWTFEFDGNQLVTGYAKYLLEFLNLERNSKGLDI